MWFGQLWLQQLTLSSLLFLHLTHESVESQKLNRDVLQNIQKTDFHEGKIEVKQLDRLNWNVWIILDILTVLTVLNVITVSKNVWLINQF